MATRHCRWIGLLVLAVLLSGHPAPVAAADWVERVPPEPGAVMLPHLVFDAATADLDGDGQRELVRLIPGVGIGGAMAIDLWKRVDGEWGSVGEPQAVYREARVGEFAPRRVFTLQSELAPVLPREPSRLLVVRDGERERVLVAASGEPGTTRACCLTVWQVESSGSLTLVPVVGTVRPAETLLALDLSGDGRDELLATAPPDASLTTGGGLQIAAYRLADGQLQVIDRVELPASDGTAPVSVEAGDRPGREVAVIADGAGAPMLYRIDLDGDGLLRHEAASIPFGGQVGQTLVDGAPVLVVSGDHELIGLRWPEDEDPELIGRAPVGGDLLPAISDGANALIAVAHRPPNVLHLLGSDFRSRGPVTQTSPVGRLLGTPVSAYVGPLPGGDLAGRQAIVFRGRLLGGGMPLDGRGAHAVPVGSIGSFAAAQPVGYLGDGGWLAVIHTLGPWLDLERAGGELAVARTFQDARLAIVPAAAAFSTEAGAGRLRPPVSGAVVVADRGDRQVLMARGEGFEVQLSAPPGSRVLPVVGDPPLPADARLILVPASGEMTLRIQPPVATPARSRYQARLVVVTPAGKAYTAAWQIEVRDVPPHLAVEPDATALSFRVEVSGRTEPGVAVTIDGQTVRTREDGSFSGSVGASLWPRAVNVEAIDPLGNRAVETVSVVGPIDYRRLPWIPIVAALTILAAVGIYLRAPRPAASRAGDDEALQDLDDSRSGRG